MKKLLIPLISVSFLSGCIVHVGGGHDDSPREHFSKHLTLSIDDIERLDIDAGAGELNVVGVEGLRTIEVDAQIWAYSRQGDDYSLSLESHGDEAQLIGKNRSSRGFNFNSGRSPRIDMTVRVPKSLMLFIDDGSGDIVISNIQGKVSIDDGSGSINIDNLGDDLSIEDNSGSIRINGVQGKVDIDDNSGNIIITNVKGKVYIEDGSGDIEVSDVSNSVKIDDGSGDIEVSRVDSLKIIESGSGDVIVHDVGSYSK
ncbi:MAG: DUF4097 family beta strand repeat protein [Algicola sp.]|nr:DUF4097 family beta strand repeat protein [Algicola sp.]